MLHGHNERLAAYRRALTETTWGRSRYTTLAEDLIFEYAGSLVPDPVENQPVHDRAVKALALYLDDRIPELFNEWADQDATVRQWVETRKAERRAGDG